MKTLALYFGLFAIAISAAELDINTHRHIHYCYLNGMRYAFAISDARFSKMRQWNPTSDAQPPVTPKRALELARKRLDTIKIPPNFGWKLESIALEPVRASNFLAQDEKWMYVVNFRYHNNSVMTGVWPTMDFIITMDDELIEPIIDKEKPNR